jgi:hypothetical protein
MRRTAVAVAATALLVVVPPAWAGGNGHELFRFQDDRITESSGLVDLGDGLMATVNDSGDGPYVYVVDGAGRTVGVTDYGGDAVDVESMAPIDASHVWVGDTGGNIHARAIVQVYRVPVGRGNRTVEATGYDMLYPDSVHDAETLLANPRTGRLYVVSKTFLRGTVYAAPRHLRPGVSNRMGVIGSVPGMVTDGTFLADGRHVLLRGYGSASVYTFPGLQRVGPVIDLPRERQGEGISVGPGGRIRLSTEGAHTPVLQMRLPATVRNALADAPRTQGVVPRPHHHHGLRARHRAHRDQRRGLWWAAGAGVFAVVFVAGWVWSERRRRP